jgi:phosphoglycolate phosphatase-like HAD superfamily hydrolase
VARLSVNSEIIEGIQLVIFDKDGTLIDLYTYWANMVALRVELAQKKLGFDKSFNKKIMYAMGVDLEKRKLRSEGPVGLKKREVVMQAMIDELMIIGLSNTHDLCFEVFKEVDKLSYGYFPQIIRPIDGMYDLVNSLCKKKCKIAIATTDKTERAELAMKHLGIFEKIDIVIGEDKVKNCKPAEDMINLILERLDVGKENAVMVGDAITDIEMGVNAKIKASIGVCSGLTSRDKLSSITKYVVDDISVIVVK